MIRNIELSFPLLFPGTLRQSTEPTPAKCPAQSHRSTSSNFLILKQEYIEVIKGTVGVLPPLYVYCLWRQRFYDRGKFSCCHLILLVFPFQTYHLIDFDRVKINFDICENIYVWRQLQSVINIWSRKICSNFLSTYFHFIQIDLK